MRCMLQERCGQTHRTGKSLSQRSGRRNGTAGVRDGYRTGGKKILQGKQTCKVLAFYKPVGVVCTERDPHAEKKIMDMIRCPERLTYAGRLDKDSEGLILLTNDGDLINAMMRGANRHEKEYIVKIDREITPDFWR